MNRSTNKIGNAFAILRILNSVKSISCLEISRALNISVRSVHRLIDELTVIGFPINTYRGRWHGGISLAEDFKKRVNSINRFVLAGADDLTKLLNNDNKKTHSRCANAQ